MKRLSIAVVGLGGIGSAFAYKLALAGHDVTAIARTGSARLHQLQQDRGILLKGGERAEVGVMDQLDQQVPYDLVLVTTLAHQVDAVIPSLQNSNAKCVHFMFNNFNPERLRDLVGLERCTFGMPFVMAHLDLDGKLNLRINPGQKTLHSDPRWVDLFRDAGLPSDLEKDMLLWLRCHTPLCIAFESISIAGERRHGGANWPESMSVARGMRAGFAILRGRGYRIYPSSKSILSHAPTFLIASMLWSLSRVTSFRTLLATGANECRALIEAMAEAGTNMNPALPEAVAALTAIKPTQKR